MTKLDIAESIFVGILSDCRLIVPKGTKAMYQSTKPWSDFKYIEEAEEESGDDTVTGDVSDLSKYNDAIYFDTVEGQSGTSVTLSLRMKNAMPVSGLQANLYVPEGLKITKVNRGEGLKVFDENDEQVYTFECKEQNNGSHFLLAYSTMNIPMSSGDKEIAKVTIEIDEDVKAGDYPLDVRTIEMSYGSENVRVAHIRTLLTVSDYVLGDANSDGIVSVTDITSIGGYLMDNSKPINLKAADANQDGNITVTDITLIGKMLFSNAINNAKSLVPAYTRQTGDGVNIVIADGEAKPGSEITLPITMTGSASAFQFDVYTPQGVSIKKVQRGSLIKALDDNDEYIFTFQSMPINDGAFYRVVVYNTTDTPTTGAGEVIKLVLEIDDNLAAGEYDIQLKEIECGQSGVVLSTYKEYTAKLTVGKEKLKLTASPSGGTVESGTKVALTSNVSTATIYYTLDGSTPNKSSSKYTSAITISKTLTLKAIAYHSDYTQSDVLIENYTIKSSTDKYNVTIDGLKYILEDGKATVARQTTSISGNIIIPESVSYKGKQYEVVRIGFQAFYNCYKLTGITIPNGVTTIEARAFMNTGLLELNIPNNVDHIGTFAFANTDLSYVKIPSSVYRIEMAPFHECDKLKSIDVDFNNSNYCSKDGVLYSKDMKTLCAYPENKTGYSFKIPETVTRIDSLAFYGQNWLNAINIPNSVTHMCWSCFENCKFTDVFIPNSVISIEERTFASCYNLRTITVDNGNQKYDSRGNCNAIIEKATNTLIAGCNNTIIPNSVINIGSYAFWGHEFTSFTIPKNIKGIGETPFSFSFIDELKCQWTNLDGLAINENAFLGVKYYDITLIVPKGTKAMYQSTKPWSDFKYIEEENSSGIDNITASELQGEARIYNSAGVMVKQVECNDNMPALLNGLDNGIYIIKSNGVTRKVVKK